MNQNSSVRKLARCAVVAAIYVVLCMALQPFSYGAVQVRVAEALCLLPVFGPEYIAGVVLGCFLANLLGSTIVDVIFGTLATLLACLVTYKLRDLRFKGLALAASLPPVLFNAVIIGIEIAVLFPDPSSSAPLWLACITNGISVIAYFQSKNIPDTQRAPCQHHPVETWGSFLVKAEQQKRSLFRSNAGPAARSAGGCLFSLIRRRRPCAGRRWSR